MGAILKGRDTVLGRALAVKVVLEKHLGKKELLRRFDEEARITGQLQHPGIVPIHELGKFADGRPYFTMRLVQGRTLASLLSERTHPGHDQSRFLSILLQVAQTVGYAHAQGVIHRDLKPANVMVGGFGEVQVMDWGLAKVLSRGIAADGPGPGQAERRDALISSGRDEADSGLTEAGSVLGTPPYMSPEQARGEVNKVDKRSDVFSLGSMLCEILTGRPAARAAQQTRSDSGRRVATWPMPWPGSTAAKSTRT